MSEGLPQIKKHETLLTLDLTDDETVKASLERVAAGENQGEQMVAPFLKGGRTEESPSETFELSEADQEGQTIDFDPSDVESVKTFEREQAAQAAAAAEADRQAQLQIVRKNLEKAQVRPDESGERRLSPSYYQHGQESREIPTRSSANKPPRLTAENYEDNTPERQTAEAEAAENAAGILAFRQNPNQPPEERRAA